MTTKSIVEVYADIISHNKPWTPKEEKDAIAKMYRSDREKFVSEAMKHNLALVFALVKKHAFKLDEDIIQVAVSALVDALRKYNPKKGVKISTWVTNPVKWAIQKELGPYSGHNSFTEKMGAVNRMYGSKYSVVSVDSPVSGSDESDMSSSLGDLISEKNIHPDYKIRLGIRTQKEIDEDNEPREKIRVLLERLKSSLTDREKFIVVKYLSGYNLTDISKMMKVSKVRVTQITQAMYAKIRESKEAYEIMGRVILKSEPKQKKRNKR